RPFLWGHHTAAGFFYAINGLYSGGYSLEWLFKVLNDNFDLFNKLSDAFPDQIPIFIPYIRGADYEEAKGAFLNLDDNTDRKTLLQGLVICLCFELRSIWEEMEKTLEVSIEKIINVGGAAHNQYWMNMKASVLKHTISIPKDKEFGCRGAALLAGIGCGIFRDADDTEKNAFELDKTYKPDDDLVVKLDTWYRLYSDLIEDMKVINKKIDRGMRIV
ncbi:MAG: FGGY-family carbohydrate kinase, partial [Spirochaetota bacterium]